MSRLNGGNRFFGTIIGGMVGTALFRVYIMIVPDAKPTPLTLLFLLVGVVVLISCCQFFKWPGGIQPGGVVLCILLFNTPVETYISYSVFRMIDTGVGGDGSDDELVLHPRAHGADHEPAASAPPCGGTRSGGTARGRGINRSQTAAKHECASFSPSQGEKIVV